jgi:multidrug efflux pump
MARFFIDRPIFAWVIAIIIMLAGGLALFKLPVSMYPNVAPPAVEISATYPGASAKVVEDSVTQIIEQNMKGLDGLIYFSSNSSSNGQATITLTFESGTNPDIAQVQVQNKLQLAMPLLPQEVQRQGINVAKSSSGFLNVIAFVSENGSMDANDIADYVGSNVVDRLSRVPGVGNIQVFGGKYAMRIWLDPNKLHTYGLSVAGSDRSDQGAERAGGDRPARRCAVGEGQQLNATINAQSRLQTPEQFRNIILRGAQDGAELRLGTSPASSWVPSPTTSSPATTASRPAAWPSPGHRRQRAGYRRRRGCRAGRLKSFFPAGLKAEVPYDTTPFVRVSIKGVVQTLIEAIVLVFVVMYLFLQNFRATLIPTIAVPVVLLGTFGVLAMLGFSINMLTMFAMVLAIGLLVDDAIVVVENVERIMSEEGLSPLEATRKSMGQITGALVGIGLVLSAVFVPMAFERLHRRDLPPVLGHDRLGDGAVGAGGDRADPGAVRDHAQAAEEGRAPRRPPWPGRSLLQWFNRGFDRTSESYQRGVRGIIHRPWRFMGIVAALFVLMGVLFVRLPSSFLPNEDQGVLMALVQAPVGATQERTLESIAALENHFLQNEKDAVDSVFSVQGFSFAGMGQNAGMAFVKLKDWSERDADNGVMPITGRAMAALGQIKDAFIFAFPPPAIPELGTASGFTFFLKDNSGQGHEALVAARNQLLGLAAGSKKLANVRPNGQEDTPQFRIDIDAAKATSLGLSIDQINGTLAAAWGSSYIDDFVDRGRVKRVFVQADQPFRMVPEDFDLWSVKNDKGEMVPFSAFATKHWDYGSPRLERYNGVSAMEIQGEPAPGVASGDAMAEIEQLAKQLPAGFGIEWTAMSYQERQAGSQTPLLYTLSLMIVFLCLAAMYESWSVPTAVLLAAPLGILGAVLANTFKGLERDIYFQVAMLTTVGLTSKNAILIVEFAKENLEKGASLIESIMHAVRDRLRPIVMTSLAFGMGVVPLAISTGAGSGAKQAIGTGVLGGMIVGTVLGVFFVPLFFVVVQRVFKRKSTT